MSRDSTTVRERKNGRLSRWSWYRRSPLSKDFPSSFRFYSAFYLSYAFFGLGYISILTTFLGPSHLPGWFFISYLPFFPMLFVFVLWRIRLDEKIKKREEEKKFEQKTN
jgi:Ca2+/Na+ antiporter